MSSYFLTGGTGFLGRRLISRLLAQPACDAVYVLVRTGSLGRFDAVARQWDSSRIVPVTGDLTSPALVSRPFRVTSIMLSTSVRFTISPHHKRPITRPM
jgi:nucleoside-diphosphate-sugar epimerase